MVTVRLCTQAAGASALDFSRNVNTALQKGSKIHLQSPATTGLHCRLALAGPRLQGWRSSTTQHFKSQNGLRPTATLDRTSCNHEHSQPSPIQRGRRPETVMKFELLSRTQSPTLKLRSGRCASAMRVCHCWALDGDVLLRRLESCVEFLGSHCNTSAWI